MQNDADMRTCAETKPDFEVRETAIRRRAQTVCDRLTGKTGLTKL
jgi:hypothetical protein